jgi:hypothetical protein
MARIEIDPNFSSPTFSRATASTDLFKKEDVQALAAAVSTHVHDGAGKGLSVAPGAATIPGSALTNGSVTLGKLAADSVDSSKIVDGTIATADLANASVTNAKLATDTARANLLTNGGFEVWQRGVGPFTLNGAWTADRWALAVAGADTLSLSRDTANVDVASQYCAVATYVRAVGATLISQPEGTSNDLAISLRGKTVTFSARVKTSTANAVRLRNGDGIGGPQNGAYHSGSGTYETLTITYAVATNATALAPAFQFDQTCTAYIDNAMLVVGSVAADYAPLHPADDLARCLRYYESSADTVLGSGYAVSATGADTPYKYLALKGGTPTITLNAPATYSMRVLGSPVACTAISSFFPGTGTVLLAPSIASGLTNGAGMTLTGAAGAVKVEFNP